MIIDLVVTALAAVVQPLLNLLPQVSTTWPGAGAFSGALCKINTLLPVLGPLQLALLILGAVGAFIGLRAILMLRYILLP